ncbi:MAG: L,D-transpeptidase family protein [Fulvivirga sp.]
MNKRRILFILILLLLSSLLGYNYWPEDSLPEDIIAAKLVVHKSQRILELWSKNEIIKTYKISLGQNPVGHKEQEGDSKTPEGVYYINDKNPNSQFYLNLGISYPNANDKKNAANPGGDIKVHGLRNGIGFIGKLHRLLDWTDGCIAVTNAEIEELYRTVEIGTPIEIKE